MVLDNGETILSFVNSLLTTAEQYGIIDYEVMLEYLAKPDGSVKTVENTKVR
jgi:hypothetical protein